MWVWFLIGGITAGMGIFAIITDAKYPYKCDCCKGRFHDLQVYQRHMQDYHSKEFYNTYGISEYGGYNDN